MKKVSEYKPIVLGIDHGYGNIKTAHRVFMTGVDRIVGGAVTKDHILQYRGESYAIGESHLTYQGDKTQDQNFHILTLAAIAEELQYRRMNEANLILAVGLPLVWLNTQLTAFGTYLKQDGEPEFDYKGQHYHVHIHRVMIFPQGMAASLCVPDLSGDCMIADIGNGTMNIARYVDGAASESSLATETYGVSICVHNIRAALSRTLGRNVDERIIENLLRSGCEGRTDDIARMTAQIAGEYTAEIVKRLTVFGYVEDYVKLFVFGGGGCLLKHYSPVAEKKNVVISDDICANAKGYELMAKQRLAEQEQRKIA